MPFFDRIDNFAGDAAAAAAQAAAYLPGPASTGSVSTFARTADLDERAELTPAQPGLKQLLATQAI